MRLVFPWTAAREFDRLSEQLSTVEQIAMATKAEVETKLQSVVQSLDKISTETSESLSLIEQLKEQVANTDNVPDSIAALVEQIEAKVKSVDDLVADATPNPPEDGTGETPAEPDPAN